MTLEPGCRSIDHFPGRISPEDGVYIPRASGPRRIGPGDGEVMYDKFRKKYRVPAATERLRRQIALEAARRLLDAAGDLAAASTLDWLERTGENDFYVAKAQGRGGARPPREAGRPALRQRGSRPACHSLAIASWSGRWRRRAGDARARGGRRRGCTGRAPRPVRRLPDAPGSPGSRQAEPEVPSRGRRTLSQPSGLSPGARGAAL